MSVRDQVRAERLQAFAHTEMNPGPSARASAMVGLTFAELQKRQAPAAARGRSETSAMASSLHRESPAISRHSPTIGPRAHRKRSTIVAPRPSAFFPAFRSEAVVLSSGALETKGPFNMSAPVKPAPFECAPPLLIRLQKLENRAGPALWQKHRAGELDSPADRADLRRG
jgi:hypothetical protein